jgi:glycosyltransferase involved in cell wall biosynthesis
MRLSFFAHTVSGNALGRVYSLWLLAEALGWDTLIHVPHLGPIWAPLQDEHRFRSRLTTSLDDVPLADALIAVKPLLGSFGVALRVRARTRQPLVLDVDDPDWEEAFGFERRSVFIPAVKRTVRGRPRYPVDRTQGERRQHISAYRESRLRSKARRLGAVAISNPMLAQWYPGVVVPHVRLPAPAIPAPPGPGLRVAFVGTPRQHKGLEVLRAASRAVEGVRLVITANAPADAHTHEEWVGETTLEQGLRIVNESHVIALPSLDTGYARFQLPVKLIDAMIAGRAIVASDLEPLRWAAEGAALFLPPGDVQSLTDALQQLRDEELRYRLGQQARASALARFTPEAVAPVFADLISGAHRKGQRRRV